MIYYVRKKYPDLFSGCVGRCQNFEDESDVMMK